MSSSSGRGETRVLRREEATAAGTGQPESPRMMPAWKREILERRKAKGGGGSPGGAGAAAAELCPPPPGGAGGGGGQRVSNGEGTGNAPPPTTKDNGRNYTVTTANQHFASKKRGGGGDNVASSPDDLSPVKTNKENPALVMMSLAAGEGHHHESLVLHDSLGPLEDNPFIKLEKERKRRQDRDNAARPVQHILELYGSVPGIRTIRAENIIIIESDPDYFPEGHHHAGGILTNQNGVGGYSSLSDLLDRRGSAVTEIRAKEVVIYDTALSRSEENLSTLGHDGSFSLYETAGGEGRGRVSRMLQKFDSNYYGKLQKKSRSTENLLELDISTSSRPRLRTMPPQPDLVPKYTWQPQPGSPVRNPVVGTAPSSSAPLSPVFQSSPSSKPKPSVPETDRAHHHAAAVPPQPASASPKPKVPCSPETRRVSAAESPARPISSRTPQTSSEFEIRPSPKPDLTSIPEGDAQARALANLRLQSRNSFTVIPKRRSAGPSSPGSTAPSTPVRSPPSSQKAAEVPTLGVPTPHITLTSVPTPSKRKEGDKAKVSEEKEEVKRAFKPASATTQMSPPPSPTHLSPSSSFTFAPMSPSKTKEVDKVKKAFEQKEQGKKVFKPKTVTFSPPASPTRLSPSSTPVEKVWKVLEQKEEVKRAFKPASVATSISPPPSPTHLLSPVLPILAPVHRVTSPVSSPVPSLSPPPSPVPSSPVPSDPPSPASEEPLVPEDRLPVTNIDDVPYERSWGKTFTVTPKQRPEAQPQQQDQDQPGSTPPQAPYAQLGSLLKKRYPAVEEIEVIGGYLSLTRSCLAKTGSAGKKLKISFNESILSSTYEYPSESTVWDSGDEEDEEESVRREGRKVADDQPSMVGRIHIPRPSFSSSPTHHHTTTNNTDLSSYVPKHSVDFNAWQEHKLDDPVYQGDANSQHTQMSEEVMLTPADSSSLSDFSSEPALYF